MEVGRPRKTLSDAKLKMPSDWFNQILEEYSEGASDVEIRAMLINWLGTFSTDLWERWIAEEPEFSETIKKGKQLSEAWWYRTGRKNMMTKDFSYTGWYMNMKNRFGWADRTNQNIDQNSNVNLTLSDEDLINQIKELNAKFK